MVTLILLFGLIVLMAVGALLIHLLNDQHEERIAAHHYSDPLPGVGRQHRKRHHATTSADRSGGSDRSDLSDRSDQSGSD
ncbi:hypothetical protein ACFVT5_28255 [Streptomyces sp. NPDC058001]|uniref:hypothetical protein n=1 Tax=Streptomyces sp. NPDC058001 TaxID=3346300 RepID=UPI0036E41D51